MKIHASRVRFIEYKTTKIFLAMFLESRFHPPLPPDRMLITRPVVSEAIGAIRRGGHVVVKAPAGYGKTSALLQIYQEVADQQAHVVWLSLFDFSAPWIEFALYLSHAVAKVRGVPSIGLSENSSLKEAATVISNSLGSLAGETYVFLDDLDSILGTPAEQLVSSLIRNSAVDVHWVVGCRQSPSLGVARLRAQGLIVEIDTDALRFSEQEAKQMLSQVSRQEVSENLSQIANQRTEGWPAGLQLISIALGQLDGEETLLKRFSGQNRGVHAFFEEEVFNRLDQDIQSFLLKTCTLGRFSPDLCNELVARSDSREMITRIEQLGLFLFSIDPLQNWYRYHDLFKEFLTRLLRQLHPEQEASLHLCASHWFFSQSLIPEAIEHAFKAEDFLRAAEILNISWHSLNEEGIFSMAVRWCAAIPSEILDNFPDIQLWRAWYLACERKFADARLILSGLDKKLDLLKHDTSTSPERLATLQADLAHRWLMLAQYSDDPLTTEQLYLSLHNGTNISDPLLLATSKLAYLNARREQYKLDDTESIAARALASCQASGKQSSFLWHCSAVGPSLVARGQTTTAIRLYRNVINLSTRLHSDSSDFRSMPIALLAELLLERNELDEARALFTRVAELGTGVGLVENLIAYYVGRARLASRDNQLASSNELLDEGYAFAAAKGLSRLCWHIVHERVRQALARQDLPNAKRIAADSGLPMSGDSLSPNKETTSGKEVMAITWARLAIASGNHNDALLLMKRWTTFLSSRNAVVSLLRCHLLMARALYSSGDNRAALRSVHQAISLAAPAEWTFLFFEEGEPILSLVNKALELDGESDATGGGTEKLRLSILNTARANSTTSSSPMAEVSEQASSPTTPLNSREIEILRYVSRSMLNKEIADRLGLTEGSVKWYLQQIYGKLGVRRRLSALDKARALGYLS